MCKGVTILHADCYAVAMKKDDVTIGHVPRMISKICALFLEHNSIIFCTVTGPRRHSKAQSHHPSSWNPMRGKQKPFCWHFQSLVVSQCLTWGR